MNTQRWQLNWNKLGIFTAIVPITVGAALMTATPLPASAQSVIVIEGGTSFGVRQSSPAASFIYGSPIPTPVPVNPATGLLPSRTYNSYPGREYRSYPGREYHSYPVRDYHSYPVRRTVENSTLFNPILVNPNIQDSTLINPTIVNDRGSRRQLRSRESRRILLYHYR